MGLIRSLQISRTDFISQPIVLINSYSFKQYIQNQDSRPMNNECKESGGDESSLWSQLLESQTHETNKCLFGPIKQEYFHDLQTVKAKEEPGFDLPDGELPLSVIPMHALEQSCDYSCCDDNLHLKTHDCLQEEQGQNLNSLLDSQEMIKIVYNWSMTFSIAPREGQQKHIFDPIFEERDLRAGWKKNTNVPKFIARLFMKHFPSFVGKGDQDLIKIHKNVSKKLLGRSSNNYSISDVLSLLRDDDGRENVWRRNQKIMSAIARTTMRDEIIENKYIKDNHKSYMIAMKIYALRCRSKTLTERVKVF